LSSAGTKLISISGNVKRPGNYEIELGTPARELIYGLAGGIEDDRELKFWFPGGSSSPVLLPEDLDVPYDFNSIAALKSMLGSGAIIVVDDSNSVVDVCLWLAQFYRHESCGKCSPCREGTNWTVKMLERIHSGHATPMDLDIMASVQENIIGNCLCVLGDAMAMPVSSMIKKFRGGDPGLRHRVLVTRATVVERLDAHHERRTRHLERDPAQRQLRDDARE